MNALVLSVFVALCLLFTAGDAFAEQKAIVVYENAAKSWFDLLEKHFQPD